MTDNSKDVMRAVLNILRRQKPSNIENDLARILWLLPDPDMEDEVTQRCDQPLQVAKDTKSGKDFIKCEYNRDSDNYRSPWSNEYFPPLGDGLKPLGDLRAFEEQANRIFDEYRKLYFEGGVSSVYVWDLRSSASVKGEHFGAAFCITKKFNENEYSGRWDSIHVVETKSKSTNQFSYKLTSTILVDLTVKK